MKPSEMSNQELIEAWFVEALEWEYEVERTGNIHGQDDTEYLGEYQLPDLPDILDSESAFNEWVLPVMEERKIRLITGWYAVRWYLYGEPIACAVVKVKDNRRLRASVEGALEILRERHDK